MALANASGHKLDLKQLVRCGGGAPDTTLAGGSVWEGSWREWSWHKLLSDCRVLSAE